MPPKTIYVRDEDTSSWEQAEDHAHQSGMSMSQLLAQLLRQHLATTDPEIEVVTATAEVVVVRIGSRSLTRLMVYQLDYVSDRDCEPFGRFKVKGDLDVHVIGRHVTDGSLVKAKRSRPGWNGPEDDPFLAAVRTRVGELAKQPGPFDLVHFVDLVEEHRRTRAEVRTALWEWSNDQYIEVVRDGYRRGRGFDEMYFSGQTAPVEPGEPDEQAKRAFDEWLALPLIVLAD